MKSKHRFLRRAGAAMPSGMRRAATGHGSPLVFARTVLRLLMPALLVLTMAFGQLASAHPAGGQHRADAGHAHASRAMSHHSAKADIACCGDLTRDEDGRACLAQCLAACGYFAPLPLPAAFPDLTAMSPAPAASAPLRGAIAPPAPRPPSIA